MSVDIVPKSLKQLRACLVCSLIKTFDQFESDGCDNCESVLHLKRNRDNVYDCTSSNFEVRYLLSCHQIIILTSSPPQGMVAACRPEDSWVCRWQRISKFNKGVYAISVQGRLPPAIVSDLRRAGVVYKSRDTSKM